MASHNDGPVRTRFHIGRGKPKDAADDFHLSRIGKTPVLKRRFAFMSIFGLACIVLNEWSGTFYTFQIGFTNGGPSGLLYGYIIAWIGTLATFVSLAELASMAPVASGQYHWISLLAPRSSQKVLSYIVGWLTVLGWQTGIASASFGCAGQLQTLIEIVNPGYKARLWHTTLLLYAVLAVAVFFTTVLGSTLSAVETAVMVLYLCGFFAVLVPLIWLSPHGDAKFVFNTFLNEGGWNSQGTSFLIGMLGVSFVFLGADCIYHMSEEIHNARVVVPRAIIVSLLFGGLEGLATVIAILFCIGNPADIINVDYQYPFAALFLQATHSRAGSAVMTLIIIILQLGAVIGVLAAASRMLWSFSRDHGVPGWRWIGKLNSRSSIPVNAIIVSVSFSVLVGLISVGSPIAFNDVLSMSVSALYASYFATCFGLFCRRVQGRIKSDSGDAERINLPGSEGRLVWGPWRTPRILGTVINGFACAYLAVMFFFSFWPTATPVNATSMNYSILVFGAAAVLSGVYYAVWARKTYKGPVVEAPSADVSMSSISVEPK